METKHTPGPWDFHIADNARTVHAAIENADGDRVADVYERPKGTPQRMAANASLIAAAPDLLAALRPLVSVVNGARVHKLKKEGYLNDARAAIAKATGQ